MKLKPETKAKLDKQLDELRGVRDDLRVRIHLAGMDARDALQKLEPRIDKVEQELRDATEDVTDKVAASLEAIAHSVRELNKKTDGSPPT